MNKNFPLIQRLLFFFLFIFASFALAEISMQVTPEKVQEGESFRLMLTSNEPDQTGLPDLTPLQKNFRILSTESSVSYTIINGQTRSMKQWMILLRPKQNGIIPIPSLEVGQLKTKPTQVEVIKNGVSAQQPDKATPAEDTVLLRTEASSEAPFVSQQVLYTVKLYNSGRLLDAEYQPPTVENALLIPLGDSDRYQTVENGRSYLVEEQRYAIFPQKSGEVRITGPSFHALVYDAIPRQINIRSKIISLNVKPIPQDFKGGQWLPAKEVTLSEEYEQLSKNLQQGDTLTRTITIEAVAVPGQLLPALNFSDNPQFNVYPEKPEIQNHVRQQELVGKTTIKVTYLMNKAGEITIPEMEIPWFNTVTNKEAIAKLPPRTLKIAEGQAVPKSPDTAPMPAPSVNSAAEVKPDASTNIDGQAKEPASPLAWFLAIVFGVAWILTLTMWWYRPKYVKGQVKRAAVKRLHEACIRNNPSKARAALLRWAAIQWSDKEILDLTDLAKQVHNPEFKKQLNRLSEALYSTNSNNEWQGADLWLSLAAYRKKNPVKKGKRQDLPPINP